MDSQLKSLEMKLLILTNSYSTSKGKMLGSFVEERIQS